MKNCLREYKTNVRKNGQAVTLHYDSWPNVDIVPVSRIKNQDGSINCYEVPDMTTERWIKSRPRKHSSNLEEKNKECGDMFKRIVKMIKWWNNSHGALLQSFHIEVMALNIFNGQLTDYPWDIHTFFNKAIDLLSRSLWYESGYADSYLTYANRQTVSKKISTARDLSAIAWYLNRNGDTKKAIETWKQLFGTKFPVYG